MDRYDDRDVIITNLIDSYTRLMEFVKKHTNDKFYLNEDTQVFCAKEKSIKEILDYFGYKSTKSFKKQYLTPLIDKGVLAMTIPDKPTSRNQKYISKGTE